MGNNHDKTAENQTLKDKLMAIILLETAKDYKKMDSDLVTECVDFLVELEGKERLTKEEIEQRVNEIPFKGKVTALNSYAKKKLRAKRVAIIAAVLAVLITLFGMLAIGSGDTVTEFFRQIGDSISTFLNDGPKEHSGITFYKNDKTITYSSLEEFKESEGVDILYPTWLPEDEKIIEIRYLITGETELYTLRSNEPDHSIEVELEAELAEDFLLNWTKKEVASHLVYYMNVPEYVQASFVYENNLYCVKSDTEDNLFRIIENLKEIS
ncbi:MAG: hypothetical protein IIX16_08585 [Clostridia bacterium]|nr:hypothetical protein [Clostridia bacterium]